MKYLVFLQLLISTLFGQEFITSKSTVACIDSTNFVMLAKDDGIATVFKCIHKLNTCTTISTLYKSDADLFLSSGIRIHLPEESEISINSAEQDVSKDEVGNVQVSGDGIGIVFNAKISHGSVDFKLDSTPNESSVIIVLTDHAELEVHAKQFTIVVSSYGCTRVRCIDGYLLATTPHNIIERIENEEVSITASELGVNAVVLRTLTSIQLYGWQSKKLPIVKWKETELMFSEFHTEP